MSTLPRMALHVYQAVDPVARFCDELKSSNGKRSHLNIGQVRPLSKGLAKTIAGSFYSLQELFGTTQLIQSTSTKMPKER